MHRFVPEGLWEEEPHWQKVGGPLSANEETKSVGTKDRIWLSYTKRSWGKGETLLFLLCENTKEEAELQDHSNSGTPTP